MAEDFSNWDEDDGTYDNSGGTYDLAGDDVAADAGGDYIEEDGGVVDDQTYDADGTIEEGDENGAAEDGGEYVEDAAGEADGDEYVGEAGDEEAVDEDGGEEVYAEDDGGDPDYQPAEDDQYADEDGDYEGQEEMAEEEEEALEEQEPGPVIDDSTMSALEAARRKALSGRFGGAPPAAAPSAFGSAFGGGGASAFGAGAAKQSAFGSGAPSTTFNGFLNSTPAATTKPGKESAFSSFKPNAFQQTPAPAAPVVEKTERMGKREKREKQKREKAEKNSGGNMELGSGGLDSNPDSLMTRSKRFSNMAVPSPSMDASPSLSSSPRPFLGGPPAAPRSTASMMAAAMGGGGGGGGEDDEDGFTADNFRAIVGQCQLMCPLEEQQARQESRDLSYFEIIPGTGSKDHGDVPLVDPEKAVKKYKRAAAAQTLNAKDVRPPHVLQQTMSYLVSQIMDRTDSPDPPPLPSFLVIYRFISDRMRALRQDFVCQQQKDPVAIKCYEIMVRFHILTMYELGDVNNIEKFDPTPNMEKLSQTLTSLRHMFLDNYTNPSAQPFPTPNEAEMHSYRLLTELDRKFGTLYEELDKFSPAIKASPIIQFCVAVYNAFRENNYARFFRLASHAPYLHSILLQGFFSKVRDRALERMVASYMTYPFEEFVELLGFEDEGHAVRFLTHYGLEYQHGSPHIRFDRDAFHRPSSLFPFRNAHTLIARKRPEKISKAVLQAVGRGEGLGLEQAAGIKPSLLMSAGAAEQDRLVRQAVVKPQSNSPAVLPPSSFLAPQSLPPSVPPFNPPSGFKQPTLGASAFSAGGAGAGFNWTGGATATSTTATPVVDTKAIKLQRKIEPTAASFTAPVSTAPSAFGGLNPKAAPFVPGAPFGVAAEVTSGVGASSFSGFNTKSLTTTEKAPSSTPPTTHPVFGKDESMRSVSSSTQPMLSKPPTPKGPPPSGFGLSFPPVPTSSVTGFPPIASTSISSTGSSNSTKPPTPLLPPAPMKDTTNIAGFNLPAPTPSPQPTLPASTGAFTLQRSQAMSNNMMDTSSSFSGPDTRTSYSLGAVPSTAGTSHPRLPLPHSSTSARPITPVIQAPPVPEKPKRPASPSPRKAERWFLSALHHYKHSLIKTHLVGWITVFRKADTERRIKEQIADRFAATKWFLRWHAAYVNAATYRQQFRHAQEMLHAPAIVTMRLTPQKQSNVQHDAIVPFRASAHMPTTPSRNGAPVSAFLSPGASSAPPSHFISPSAGVGFGLTSPFQRLAMLGVPVQAEGLSSEEYEQEEDGDGEQQQDGDEEMDLALPDFVEADVEGYAEGNEEEEQEGENGDEEAEHDDEAEEADGGQEDAQYANEDAPEQKYNDEEDGAEGAEEEPMDVETYDEADYADENEQQPQKSAFVNSSFQPNGSTFASPHRSAAAARSTPGSALLSPSKSGHKRSRLHDEESTPSRRAPQQQPAATFHDFAEGGIPQDDSDAEEEKIESSPQRAKLFHTPSRLVARAVFSPIQSSNDLLSQLREEMDRTDKLADLMDALENRFAQPPPRW